MSDSSPDKSKMSRSDIAMIVGATLAALVLGLLLLVWGPYKENRDLKRKEAVYSQPDQKPPPIEPDDITANSLKSALAPGDPTLSLRNAATKSKVKIDSLQQNSNQINLTITGTMAQVITFDKSLASYFYFQKDGQARGAGPALSILNYKVLPIATRRGYYQLNLTAKPTTVPTP